MMTDDLATASSCRRGSCGTSAAPLSRRRNSLPSTGDRFIASRRLSDFDAAHFKLQSSPVYGASSPDLTVFSPDGACGWSKAAHGRRLSCLSEGRNEGNVLAFSNTCTPAGQGGRRGSGDVSAQLKSMYEDMKFANGKPKRHLPTSPDQVLDMPNLRDDFYSNTLDWSKRDMIAVAIEDEVYTWKVGSDNRTSIPGCVYTKDISALAWDPEGRQLAIGDEAGNLLIWNAEKEFLEGFEEHRVCSHYGALHSISWEPDGNTIYTAQDCGCVLKIDLRTNILKSLTGHRLHSAYGTSVSPDGRYIACGGDNKTVIWSNCDNSTPLNEFYSSKNGTTKALKWCPWQPNILATGGAVKGGALNLWNIHTGEQVEDVRTESEISSLVWAPETKELVTAHGTGHDDIIVWKTTNQELEPIGNLKGHNGRVLNLALSPDGSTLASCGADESLMLWKCFSSNSKKSKKVQKEHPLCLSNSFLAMSIR